MVEAKRINKLLFGASSALPINFGKAEYGNLK
jgi:hypothetical protein